MKDQSYYNLVAGGVALGIVTMLVVWAGLMAGAGAHASAGSSDDGAPAHMYLTVQVNPDNGMPQYSPANFTVEQGLVVFTIADFDSVESWGACPCNVTGTVGNIEIINGSAVSEVPSTNAAHTFTIGALGVNVVSPGNSTISFEVDFTQPGTYVWTCLAPCGSAGYAGAPMGEPGYMSGTITVQ